MTFHYYFYYLLIMIMYYSINSAYMSKEEKSCHVLKLTSTDKSSKWETHEELTFELYVPKESWFCNVFSVSVSVSFHYTSVTFLISEPSHWWDACIILEKIPKPKNIHGSLFLKSQFLSLEYFNQTI